MAAGVLTGQERSHCFAFYFCMHEQKNELKHDQSVHTALESTEGLNSTVSLPRVFLFEGEEGPRSSRADLETFPLLLKISLIHVMSIKAPIADISHF